MQFEKLRNYANWSTNYLQMILICKLDIVSIYLSYLEYIIYIIYIFYLAALTIM